MAIVVTDVGVGAVGYDSAAYPGAAVGATDAIATVTSQSATFASGDLLVVSWGTEENNSGGGWNLLTSVTLGGSGVATNVSVTTSGDAGPASGYYTRASIGVWKITTGFTGTIQVSRTAGSADHFEGAAFYKVTGHNNTTPIVQSGSAVNTSGVSTTVTLGGAPATTSALFTAYLIDPGTASPTLTAPTGHTGITRDAGAWGGTFAASYKNGVGIAANTWASTATQGAAAMVVLEIAVAAAAGSTGVAAVVRAARSRFTRATIILARNALIPPASRAVPARVITGATRPPQQRPGVVRVLRAPLVPPARRAVTPVVIKQLSRPPARRPGVIWLSRGGPAAVVSTPKWRAAVIVSGSSRRPARVIIARAPLIPPALKRATPPLVLAPSARRPGLIRVLRAPLVPPAVRAVAPVIQLTSARRGPRILTSRAPLTPPASRAVPALIVKQLSRPPARRPGVVWIGRGHADGTVVATPRVQPLVVAVASIRRAGRVVLGRAPLVPPASRAVTPLIVRQLSRPPARRPGFLWIGRGHADGATVSVPVRRPIVVAASTRRAGRLVVARTPLAPPAVANPAPTVVARPTLRQRLVGRVLTTRAPLTPPAITTPSPVVILPRPRLALRARRTPPAIILRAPNLADRTPTTTRPVIIARSSRRGSSIILITRAPSAPIVVSVSTPRPVVVSAPRTRTRGTGLAYTLRAPLTPPASRAVQPIVIRQLSRPPARRPGVIRTLRAPLIPPASRGTIANIFTRATRRLGRIITTRSTGGVLPFPGCVHITFSAPAAVITFTAPKAAITHTAPAAHITFSQC